MGEVFHGISPQEAKAALALPLCREDLARTLSEFLSWLEKSRGLTLCQTFKPEYDWYMQAFANKEKLAREYLSGKPERESST